MAYRINGSAIRGDTLVSIEAAGALEKEDSAFLLCILIEDTTFIRVYLEMSAPSTGLQ
jgi:hypothetical protein